MKHLHFLLFIALILHSSFFSHSSAASIIQLPQTGQTKCYNTAGAEISCAGTGQDGELRVGVAWPNPRFSASGSCVTDNLTGLMWSTHGSMAGTHSWQGALDWVINLNSTGGLCGYTDWRLPNRKELKSLVNRNQPNSAAWLNTQGFSNVLGNYYWTSSWYFPLSNGAWAVHIFDGYVYNADYFFTHLNVLPVRTIPDSVPPSEVPKTGQLISVADGDDGDLQRGVGWPSPRFTDNSNGTVSDNLTGLIWMKDANCTDSAGGVDKSYNGKLFWGDALTWSNSLSSGKCGLSDGSHAGDWRLPNVGEQESLLDIQHNDPALPEDFPFSNVESSLYWTSSTYVGSPYVAWGVFTWGGGVMGTVKNQGGYVWPVRSGHAGLPMVTLSITKSGNGIGDVAVINGATCGTTCEPTFIINSSISLTVNPDTVSTFDSSTGWTGCTSIGANGECNVTMSEPKGVGAAFVLAPKAKIGVTGYSLLSDAYADVALGETAEILALNDILIGDVTLDHDKAITLIGGWNAEYSALSGQTVIKGKLATQNGSLRVRGIKVRQQ